MLSNTSETPSTGVTETEIKDGTICNIYLDEFTTFFTDLKITDPCRTCGIVGARHPRSRVSSNSNSSFSSDSNSTKNVLTGVSIAFFKLEKHLPEWSKNTDCRSFLKRIDLVLKTNQGIPQNDWPRVLLYVVKDASSLEWIDKNIIDQNLSWDNAKRVFVAHFQKAEYSSLLLKKFHSCKQAAGESVQSYGDRYTEICEEIERKDDDPLIIDHFLHFLHNDVRKQYENWLAMKRVEKQDVSFQLTSLAALIKTCIIFDIASKSSVSSTPSSNSSSKFNSESNSKSTDGKSKYCSFHKSTTHDTSECKSKSKQSGSGPPTPAAKSKDKSNIQCRKCLVYGHYANECPNPAASTNTSNSSTSTNAPAAPAARRPVVPPTRLTYDTLGKPATESKSSEVSGKSATIGSAVGTPARLWLFDVIRNRTFSTLIDTGASSSFIDSKLAKELNLKIEPIQGVISLADSKFTVNREGITNSFGLTAIFSLADGQEIITKQFSHCFELMDLDVKKHHFVIGRDLLSCLFPDNIPSSFYLSSPSSLSFCGLTVMQELVENFDASSVNSEQLLDEMVGFGSIPADEVKERTSVSTPSLLEDEYGRLRNEILNDPVVAEAIAFNESLSGFCSLKESIVHLDVHPDFARDGYRKQYGVPSAAHDAVTKQIETWFNNGKITLAPANCPYNSSLTVAAKKDAYGNFTGWRICLDTRLLNSAIQSSSSDRFQLPQIREVLERFKGCRFFAELDLQEAYLQFRLDEQSQPFTSFTWQGRQFMFIGAPFGIALLPSYFQRIMQHVFHEFTFTCPYIDNIPFASSSVEEHKQHLLLLVNRCNEHNLKIKIAAIKVCHSEIRCLGHLLTQGGIQLSPSKLEFVAAAERPGTGKALQSFLGALAFLRPNVRHMSEITASLDAVKNSTGAIEWSDRMNQDFDVVKKAIATAPSLAYPDFNKPFHIATDASNVGIGGVLYQPDEIGGDITPYNIVSLCSKKLNGSQLNYAAYKKELYAVVYSLRKFHEYIWGRSDLILFTDHRPLVHIFQQRELSPAVQQWLDVLLDYDFEIRYREGKLNILPDHLSRLYEAEYDGSAAWGVPMVMPWKLGAGTDTVDVGPTVAATGIISLNNIEISNPFETLVDSANELEVDSVGGENVETFTTNQIIKALVEMEKRGYVIPVAENEKLELIQREHTFGHFGREAVCRALISKKYWWQGMREDITKELSNCDACARFTVVRSGFNPAGSITSTAPWEHIQIDCSVHLPAAPGGYTALFVVIDVFTGFIILRPIRTTSAEIIANELWNIFCILGVPKIIQSDNGPENVNEIIRCLVKLNGIEHRFISPYNPRADGKVERSIQTIMSIIKKLIHGNESNWTLYVPFAQLAYNNKISSLTGSSPFSLMFGRNLNEIKDYTNINEIGEPNSIDLSNWKTHIENIQSLIYPAIFDRVSIKKDKMMKSLDKKRKIILGTAFPSGATVMLIDPHRQNKFEAKYIGPYSIVRRTRNGNYIVRDSTGENLERPIPPDQLKMISKKPRESDLQNNAYEVQSILDHRGEAGAYEYYIKWKGFNEKTWEPETNFQDGKLISDYWKSKKNQI